MVFSFFSFLFMTAHKLKYETKTKCLLVRTVLYVCLFHIYIYIYIYIYSCFFSYVCVYVWMYVRMHERMFVAVYNILTLSISFTNLYPVHVLLYSSSITLTLSPSPLSSPYFVLFVCSAPVPQPRSHCASAITLVGVIHIIHSSSLYIVVFVLYS